MTPIGWLNPGLRINSPALRLAAKLRPARRLPSIETQSYAELSTLEAQIHAVSVQ